MRYAEQVPPFLAGKGVRGIGRVDEPTPHSRRPGRGPRRRRWPSASASPGLFASLSVTTLRGRCSRVDRPRRNRGHPTPRVVIQRPERRGGRPEKSPGSQMGSRLGRRSRYGRSAGSAEALILRLRLPRCGSSLCIRRVVCAGPPDLSSRGRSAAEAVPKVSGIPDGISAGCVHSEGPKQGTGFALRPRPGLRQRDRKRLGLLRKTPRQTAARSR